MPDETDRMADLLPKLPWRATSSWWLWWLLGPRTLYLLQECCWGIQVQRLFFRGFVALPWLHGRGPSQFPSTSRRGMSSPISWANSIRTWAVALEQLLFRDYYSSKHWTLCLTWTQRCSVHQSISWPTRLLYIQHLRCPLWIDRFLQLSVKWHHSHSHSTPACSLVPCHIQSAKDCLHIWLPQYFPWAYSARENPSVQLLPHNPSQNGQPQTLKTSHKSALYFDVVLLS